MAYEWIDQYMLDKKGMTKDYKEEWGWDRYLLNGKMVMALCMDKENQPIATIKCDPFFGEELRKKYTDIVPGYYMNKTHWNSVYMNGTVPEEVVKEMLDQSYALILKSFSKKIQREITEE